MKNNNDPIVLTGAVCANDFLASWRRSLKTPAKPARGDIKIYSRPDKEAMSRPHSTAGGDYYPGTFQTSVFTGKRWTNLSVRLRVSEKQRKHGSVREMLDKLDALVRTLAGYKGETVLWATREGHTYYIEPEAPPIPEPDPVPATERVSAPAVVPTGSQCAACGCMSPASREVPRRRSRKGRADNGQLSLFS